MFHKYAWYYNLLQKNIFANERTFLKLLLAVYNKFNKNCEKIEKTLRGNISSTMLYLIEILYIKMHKLITT